MTSQTFIVNGACFLGTSDHRPTFAEAVLTNGGRIAAVGKVEDLRELVHVDACEIDAGGMLVLPGFVESHSHLLMLGESLVRPDLRAAQSLSDILHALQAHREAHPQMPRLVAGGWLFSAVPGGAPTAAMLDEAFPDIPVYLTANDLHSVWVNTAALRELGVDATTVNPLGGHLGRDDDGEPNGMLFESAGMDFAWSFLADNATPQDNEAAMRAAMQTYLEAGVTTVVDMLFDERSWATLQGIHEKDGKLPIQVFAYWGIPAAENVDACLAEVSTASERAQDRSINGLQVIGIKIITDGVIDACTAAMVSPFTHGEHPEAIWSQDALTRVVSAADAAGLRIAIHAIGDHASDIALNALELLPEGHAANHRIEHLEVVKPGNVERLARLGTTASMQPVHADPAIQENWEAQVGPDRAANGYPWRDFEESGARLVFGTDAPTAPSSPYDNLYVAATRASALDLSRGPIRPNREVALADAIAHATRDSADAIRNSSDAQMIGSLEVGARADIVILSVNPFESGARSLIGAAPYAVLRGGDLVHERAAGSVTG